MTSTIKERAMALARANKFKPLFNAEYFDAIVDAIQIADFTAREIAFNTAVENIPWLTQEEKGWLWNYLQHCGDVWKDSNVLDVHVAAKTGW